MTIGVSKFDPAAPTVADDFTTVPQAANQAINLLMGALSADNYGNVAATQTITLYDGSLFPINGGYVSVGDEIISYTSRVTNTLYGIVRGAQSTQIKAHATRSAVAYNLTATMFNVLAQALFNAQQAILNLPVTQTDSGTTDGSATVTLTKAPRSGAKILLFINGVFYTDGVDFNRVGTVLTYVNSPYPPNGNPYVAIYSR